VEDFDIPRLIDVRVDPETGPDLTTVKRRLAGVSGILVDDHGIWLENLVKLARSVEVIALAIVLCIAFAAVATVIFTTRSGMAVHHGTIEVLHLIGAQDVYIARQFQFHAMVWGLCGGLAGLGLATLTLAALMALAGGVDLPLFPASTLAPWQWVGLAAMPVAAALITMMTARITVLRALVKMP
jgi:cell division transport system permease protein